MKELTLAQRCQSYLRAFPQCADAVWVAGGGRWLYGVWQIGQDYRNASRYYGAYPKGFLDRAAALFPDRWPMHNTQPVLHAFSGSLPEGPYFRCDDRQQSEYQCRVEDLPLAVRQKSSPVRKFGLVLADPPYTKLDAEKYGSAPLNRGAAMRALAQVTSPGGHLVWLDTVWPMHRKAEWHFYGAIQLIRSTNHRVRLVSLFQRKAA